MRNIWPSLALPSGLDTNFLSTVPAVVAAYNADPLVHDKVSAAAGMDLMDGAAYLNTYTGALPCPLLLMHGGADKITSAPASKEFAGRITSAVKQLEWPGMYHEIHNEPAQEQVFEAIAEWIGTAGKI
jgi:alpha-beta hydrolase superfamily lysophospholipase